MGSVSGTPSPLRRVAPHVLGPRLPPLAELWSMNRRRALSAGFSVAAPLIVGLALGEPGIGSAAALGGFTAVYGHSMPYRRRAGVAAGVGAAVVAAIGLGGLTGGHPLLLVLTLGAVATAATAATAVWRIGPPGALPPVLVAGSASALGSAPDVVGQHVAAAAGAAVLSWAVVMLPWLWDPAGPERRALQAADAAVRGAEEGALRTTRPGAIARAVWAAETAVAAGSRRRPSLRPQLTGVEARFSRALPAIDATAEDPGPLPPGRPARRRTPLWVTTAARTGLGVAAAGLVAVLAGLPSPWWAATAAVAVLLGTDPRQARARALHRVTGTLVGTVLAGAVFAVDPPTAATVGLVGLLLIGVELFIAHQYVVAVACLTPVSLLLVHLGLPDLPGSALIAARIEETVVGIAVALAAGLLLFPRAGSRRLPAAVAGTAEQAVTAARAAPGSPADRALHHALIELNEVATAARAELFPTPRADAWRQRSRQVGDLGWALLGARARSDGDLADAVAARVLAELA